MEDPEEASSIDHIHIEKDTEIEETTIADIMSRGKVQSTSTLNNWARYINKINGQDQS